MSSLYRSRTTTSYGCSTINTINLQLFYCYFKDDLKQYQPNNTNYGHANKNQYHTTIHTHMLHSISIRCIEHYWNVFLWTQKHPRIHSVSHFVFILLMCLLNKRKQSRIVLNSRYDTSIHLEWRKQTSIKTVEDQISIWNRSIALRTRYNYASLLVRTMITT